MSGLLRREPVLAGALLVVLATLGAGLATGQAVTATVGAVLEALAAYLTRAQVTPVPAAVTVALEPQLVREVIPEVVVPGRRLGRHVRHDPRSLAFAYRGDDRSLVSCRWARRAPVLDQGDVGACTANALVGWLATDTLTRAGRADVGEQLALGIYHDETLVDGYPGIYPPDDTGSDGLAAGKVAVQRQWAVGYRHALDVLDALHALCFTGPVLLGLAWRTGCDQPTRTGRIHWTGAVRGGHEVLLDELKVVTKRDGTLDEARSLVGITNSWGTGWGQDGRAHLSVTDLRRALAQQGDVTVLDGRAAA